METSRLSSSDTEICNFSNRSRFLHSVMRHSLILLALVSSGWMASAGPIPLARISPAATWTAHLDVDALQRTPLGAAIVRQFLVPMVEGFSGQMPAPLVAQLDFSKLHGITLFGTRLQENPEKGAALLIHSDLPLQAAMDAFMALNPVKEGADDKAGPGQLRKLVGQGGGATYVLNREIFASFASSNCLVIGASQQVVDEALASTGASQAQKVPSALVKSLTQKDQGFLVLGLAEGFTRGMKLPPQAEILSQTEGMQLHLSAVGEELIAKLSLKAKAVEVASQIQQSLQGFAALASLVLPQQASLQAMMKGMRVAKQDRSVEVQLGYPMRDVLDQLQSLAPRKSAQKE